MRLGTMLAAFTAMVARHVRRARQRPHDGQVMVEFAIVFPLQLFLVAGIMQYSLIVVAHVMTNHAAFMAARAALVADDVAALEKLGVTLEASGGAGNSPKDLEQTYAEEAAWTVMATVAGSSGVNNASGDDRFMYPGLGGMPRRAAAKEKTEVEFMGARDGDVITLKVTHDYELVIPVAGMFFAFPYRGFFGGLFGGGTRGAVSADEIRARDMSIKYQAPHIPILEVGVMVRPWERFDSSGGGASSPGRNANSRHGLGLPPQGP